MGDGDEGGVHRPPTATDPAVLLEVPQAVRPPEALSSTATATVTATGSAAPATDGPWCRVDVDPAPSGRTLESMPTVPRRTPSGPPDARRSPGHWPHGRGGPRTAKQRRHIRRQRHKEMVRRRRTVVGRHPKLTVLSIVLLLLTPIWVSLGSYMTNPANGPVSTRFEEWLR